MMSSLYSAATGLNTHSRGMQIIGNNLANVSTVGFKQTMALYQDIFSSTVTSQSNNVTGLSQKGHGANLGAARTIFTQGPFESSNTVTDLAIANGNGYFGVMKDGEMLYTRAGNMRFDNEGYLLDPTGYNLVGRKVVNGVVSGNSEGIRIDMSAGSPMLTNPPKATNSVTMHSNIGGAGDMSQGGVFGMLNSWNGLSSPPLSSGQYGYSDAIAVYDDQGTPHSLNIYYDYVGTENGVKLYEYAIGIDPSADGSGRAGTAAAGLLMSGTMSFSSDGKMIGMTAFTPTGTDPSDLNAWTPAALVNGVPSIPVNFAGAGAAQQISFDCGFSMTGHPAGVNSPADSLGTPELFYAASAGANRVNGSTSAYAGSNSNYYTNQDGHTTGQLKDFTIDSEGFINGYYSNGQSERLYQISLFRFTSQDGLKHEGNNHFSASNESGPAQEGLPGTENYGTILSQTLESSNVDMAREFTNMIITQRGFQANSKIITTSDTMLQKALELKR